MRGVEHRIQLVPGANTSSVYTPYRPLPPAKQAALNAYVDKLERNGIVERVNSSIGQSQLVPFLVPKHNNNGDIADNRGVGIRSDKQYRVCT